MEIELKFQLPESKKKTVLQTLNKQKAQKIQLQAKYYDTADRLLAKNYVAIRLRQEGEHWVQTFKAASKNHLQRIEEDIYLGKCEQEPELDLSLYQHNRTVQKYFTRHFPRPAGSRRTAAPRDAGATRRRTRQGINCG